MDTLERGGKEGEGGEGGKGKGEGEGGEGGRGGRGLRGKSLLSGTFPCSESQWAHTQSNLFYYHFILTYMWKSSHAFCTVINRKLVQHNCSSVSHTPLDREKGSCCN